MRLEERITKMRQRLAELEAQAPHFSLLSERELSVFKGLAIGEPIKDIAARLGLNPGTVSTYRARILRKMACRSNAELTIYAHTHGLLTAGK